MVKKIILYIISIAVFLFAFYSLTNYVIAADDIATTPGGVLNGNSKKIKVEGTQYNHNKHIFCVSNVGDSMHGGTIYKVVGKFTITGNQVAGGSKAACYGRFAYIVWWNQQEKNAYSGRYTKDPVSNGYDQDNISAGQYLIWRRVFKNVQNQLVDDKLLDKDNKIGLNLKDQADANAGEKNTALSSEAQDLWNDVQKMNFNNQEAKITTFSFGSADKVVASTINNTTYYYFPFTAQFSGTVTSVKSGGSNKAIYSSAGSTTNIGCSNIKSGTTYYLRWSYSEIVNGTYKNAVVLTIDGGDLYTCTFAMIEKAAKDENGDKQDWTSQPLLLATADKKPNTASSQTNPPEIRASLTINKRDPDGNQNLAAGLYIQYQDGRWLTSSGTLTSSPSAISTSSSGSVKISGILNFGTYKIYEYQAPTGYDITQQPNYGADGNYPNWVYFGSINVSAAANATYTANNYYYILGINGYVWEDRGDYTKKADQAGYDSLYNNGESRLSGIKVELINKTNNTVAYTATTNNNGEYQFDFARRTVKYWDLKNYYVRFTYDNKTYVTVPVNLTAGNGSKAIESQIDNADLDDAQLTGTSGSNPGQAITYPNATNEQNSLARYYNKGNFYVENVNLGLMKKPPTDYYVSESIEYVKIVRGNYSFRYSYGDEAIVDDTQQNQAQYLSSVNYQNTSGSFTQAIYPSDIAYNMSADVTDEYQVYVVYRVDVKNNTTTNLSNLYVEQKLWLNSLTNSYESNKYELATDTNIANNLDYKSGDEKKNAINGNFDDWTDNGNGTASLKINESVYKDGIGAGSTVSSYIQFKVTEETLEKIVTATKNEDVEDLYNQASSTVDANAYHTYNRNDSNWRDNTQKTYTHKTVSSDKKASALFIKFTLKETRTILGTVFEDKQTVESSAANTRVGNGYMDSTGESTLKDVIVTLLNINDDGTIGSIAHTYPITDDFLRENTATGKWECITKNAIVNVEDNGTYSIPDVIPGEYILQFTYGDGSTSFTDTNGNPITQDMNGNPINSEIATKIGDTPIRSNYYKSTILTGAAAGATEDNKDVWFMNDIEKTNSIATDATATYYGGGRTSGEEIEDIVGDRIGSDREIYNESSKTTIVINAQSPNMDIQFEYLNSQDRVVEHNVAGSLATDLSGMYFGIIERPHIQMELESNISNVRLTLSNGTSIINGDPTQNISASLAVLDENASYVKIETDPTYLYGSTAEVTYRLKVINKSELDYATEAYYTKGTAGTPDDLVSTQVTKIINYVSDEDANYIRTENGDLANWDPADDRNKYFDPDDLNSSYKEQLLEAANETINNLYPDGSGRTSSTDYGLVINKLLSTDAEDLGWQTYSEIIGFKNVTFTPQWPDTPLTSGNYKVGDTATPTSEVDNADSTIAITPSTGADRSYTPYIVIGIAVIVLAGGIVLIKKFVLK